ncbi:probable nuclear hormone receptor HR38 [Tigriopus californicus]|uniref:probable nuclear hormone receptor HR38 n=1 Tax=Tigriopus californicus TaxID=6832 RepID=UPI0027D9FF89|nr:probable nuclear hormone receptor HR38 [Tigriopus californicus]
MSAVTDSCAVCGDRATKLRYSHYGATSCFSCRAFYRRAIEKGSFRNYACSLEKSCVITTKTRKKCPFCRFAKCKRVGMTHSSEKGSRGTSSNTSDRVPRSPTRAAIEPLDEEINGVLATLSQRQRA